jgi:hypothetical protein
MDRPLIWPPGFLAFALTTIAPPAQACDYRDNCAKAPGRDKPGDNGGAPGTIAGAGLPILAVGYGVYWLI